jgi:hypothetical protein
VGQLRSKTPGYEEYLDATGQRVDVVAAMRRTVLGATHVLEQVQKDQRDAVGGRLAAEPLTRAQSGWGVWIELDGSIAAGPVDSRAISSGSIRICRSRRPGVHRGR